MHDDNEEQAAASSVKTVHRPGWLRSFLIPTWDRRFWTRLAILAICAFVFGRYLLTPAITNGASMIPTYSEHQFIAIWRPVFWFRKPRVGDVVAVRYLGQRVMYLKRIVAVAGDTVEFREGRLFRNGEECREPWAHLTPCDWELPPRIVPGGEVYLVGDNRDMPISMHVFGHTSEKRIVGKTLW